MLRAVYGLSHGIREACHDIRWMRCGVCRVLYVALHVVCRVMYEICGMLHVVYYIVCVV